MPLLLEVAEVVVEIRGVLVESWWLEAVKVRECTGGADEPVEYGQRGHGAIGADRSVLKVL